MPKQNLQQGTVAFASGGRKIPVLQFIKANPDMASAISKTVKDTTVGRQSSLTTGDNNSAGYMNPAMQEISRNTGDRIRDADIVKQMLPDVAMGLEILISSIQSPNDMTSCELNYIGNDSIMTTELNAELVAAVKEYFTTDYKINEQLPVMLEEMLGRSGAYAVAAIPESSIDDVINSDAGIGMEQFKDKAGHENDSLKALQPLGYLGTGVEATPTTIRTPRLAMESLLNFGSRPAAVYPDLAIDSKFFDELKVLSPEQFGNVTSPLITITDNPEFMKLPQLASKLRESKLKQIKDRNDGNSRHHTMSMESDAKLFDNMSEVSDDMIRGMITKDRRYGHRPVVTLKGQSQLNRRTIGAPLIVRYPAEAVIPLHVPGDRSTQIGHLVLLDEYGYPIDTENGLSQYNQLMNNMQYGQTNNSPGGNYAMQQNARASYMTEGVNSTNMNSFGMKTQEYGALVEQALIRRLKSGVFPDGAVLGRTDEFSRVMLARSLMQQRTTILFVPEEMMTYMAFDYDANGVGKSLLDDARILHSQRIQVSVANVLASVKNSIGLTKVNVQLDEDEADVRKTIPAITEMVMGGRQNIMPMGVFNPTDVAYWATRQGLSFSFSGASALPNVKIDYEEVNTNYAKPDTDLEQLLQKRSHDAIRVPTEFIDNANGPDFATSATQNHIIFTRRVMLYQRKFTPQVTKHARQVLRAHQPMMDNLKQLIKKHFAGLKPEFTDEEKFSLKDMERNKLGAYVINKVVHAWIDSLELTLPAPDSTTLEAQQAALEAYATFVDKALEAYLSTDIFTEALVGGTVSSNIDGLKNTLKAHAVRRFIVEKNILPEVQEAFASDEEGNSTILNESNMFLNTTVKQFIKFLSKRSIISKAAEATATKIGLAQGVEGSGGTGGDDTTDDTGGGDDFGDFGDDTVVDPAAPAADAPTDDAAPTADASATDAPTDAPADTAAAPAAAPAPATDA